MIDELINNFEESRLEIDNGEIERLVSECVPPEHLEGIPFIKFDPQDSVFREDPDILGYYNTRTHEIHVNEHDRLEGQKGLKETVLHEIGHNAQRLIFEASPEVKNLWQDLYNASWNDPCNSFISGYAATDMEEDFSECYAFYKLDPDRLAMLCPEKYNFMRHYVFHEVGANFLPFPNPWDAFANWADGEIAMV